MQPGLSKTQRLTRRSAWGPSGHPTRRLHVCKFLPLGLGALSEEQEVGDHRGQNEGLRKAGTRRQRARAVGTCWRVTVSRFWGREAPQERRSVGGSLTARWGWTRGVEGRASPAEGTVCGGLRQRAVSGCLAMSCGVAQSRNLRLPGHTGACEMPCPGLARTQLKGPALRGQTRQEDSHCPHHSAKGRWWLPLGDQRGDRAMSLPPKHSHIG